MGNIEVGKKNQLAVVGILNVHIGKREICELEFKIGNKKVQIGSS